MKVGERVRIVPWPGQQGVVTHVFEASQDRWAPRSFVLLDDSSHFAFYEGEIEPLEKEEDDVEDM